MSVSGDPPPPAPMVPLPTSYRKHGPAASPEWATSIGRVRAWLGSNTGPSKRASTASTASSASQVWVGVWGGAGGRQGWFPKRDGGAGNHPLLCGILDPRTPQVTACTTFVGLGDERWAGGPVGYLVLGAECCGSPIET